MNNQKRLSKLQEKQISIAEDIRRLKEQIKLGNNKQDLVKIKLSTGTIEVEKKLHTNMKYAKDIKIPDGFRLLELNEFIELINNHYETFWSKEEFDEWIAQPLKVNKVKYPFKNIYGSAVDEDDNRSRFLGYYWDDNCVSYAFGVRFCRSL